jgi:hypothetical protein
MCLENDAWIPPSFNLQNKPGIIMLIIPSIKATAITSKPKPKPHIHILLNILIVASKGIKF